MSLLLKSVLRNVLAGCQFSKTRSLNGRSLCSTTEFPHRKTIDSAMITIKSSPKVSDVLVAVQNYLPTMNHKHMMQALRTIFELQKESKSKTELNKLLKDPGFGVLCQNFKKHTRALDANEAIEAVKILTYLQLPVDSLLVQMMLQLIRYNINYLNIRQIMFLDFLLSKLDVKNHLVDALKLALPLVFQIHLPLELDKDDLPLLCDMLAYSCHHRLPERCTNNIITGLLLHDHNIDVQTAKNVVWSLCEENCTAAVYPTRAKLLEMCFDIMTHMMEGLNYDDVLRTAAKVKSRILEKHPEYYHERFMDAVGDYIIQNGIDFERSLLVARILSRIAHTHLGLADHLCELVVSEPMLLANIQTNLLFAFINYLSNNNYIPEADILNEIKKQMSCNPIMEGNNVTLPWTKFILELASLGLYEDKLLSKVFTKDFLNQYLFRENNTLDYLQLLTLYEAVKTFHGGNYFLPEDMLEKAKSLYPVHSVSNLMMELLAQGLGGPQYVAKNVVMPNGIVVDTLICVKGGYPMEISIDEEMVKTPIEKLNIPQSGLLICVMCFNQGCFSMNSNRLRGTFRLVVDILERQGYATVPLNLAEWMEAPDRERVPYLVREVGYKCAEIGMKLSAV